MKKIIFLTLSLMITLIALNKPYHNWDMIGYVASAESYKGYDKESVHKNTYNSLKSHTDEQVFEKLIKGKYRDSIYQSSDLLDQQLPYYQIRVIYIQLINLLSDFKLNKYYATHFISAMSVLMSLLVIYHILFSQIKAPSIFAIFPLFIAPLGVLQIARYSTPDALAFLFSTGVFSLFLNKKNFTVLILLPILVLVRTDLIVLCIAFALFYVLIKRKFIKHYIASFTLCIFFYASVNSYFGNYGWHTIFYVTLIERFSNPAELSLTVNPQQYLYAFKKGMYGAIHSTNFVIYFLSTLFILVYHIKNKFIGSILSNPNNYLLEIVHYINLAFFIGHFILFPVAWDRFFVAQYVFTLLLLSMLVYKFNKSKHSDGLIAAGV